MLADHKLGDGEMGMVQVVHNVQVHGPREKWEGGGGRNGKMLSASAIET